MDNLFDPVSFGHRVKAKVEQVGNYRAAASEAHIDHRIMHRIAHGKTASVETILRVRKWLTGRSLRID